MKKKLVFFKDLAINAFQKNGEEKDNKKPEIINTKRNFANKYWVTKFTAFTPIFRVVCIEPYILKYMVRVQQELVIKLN